MVSRCITAAIRQKEAGGCYLMVVTGTEKKKFGFNNNQKKKGKLVLFKLKWILKNNTLPSKEKKNVLFFLSQLLSPTLMA